MPSHYCGTEDEVRALSCFIKLVRAAETVSAQLAAAVTAAGLSMSQFGALEALLHRGPLYQCDLGKKLLKSSGNITMVVDNLEKRGLVRRERDTADRRFITVHLTEHGRSRICELFPEHAVAITQAMCVLTAEEQEQLGRLCRKLGCGKSE